MRTTSILVKQLKGLMFRLLLLSKLLLAKRMQLNTKIEGNQSLKKQLLLLKRLQQHLQRHRQQLQQRKQSKRESHSRMQVIRMIRKRERREVKTSLTKTCSLWIQMHFVIILKILDRLMPWLKLLSQIIRLTEGNLQELQILKLKRRKELIAWQQIKTLVGTRWKRQGQRNNHSLTKSIG